MLTIKRIIKEIDNPHLNLYKCDGYFYFSYDDGVTYETYAVFTYRLNSLTLQQWKDEASSFMGAIDLI